MTVDVEFERKSIIKIVDEIQKKDSRLSMMSLGLELFGTKNKIHNAINNHTDRISLLKVKESLCDYNKKMKDYSDISTYELIRMINNLIENKGYMQTNVSRMMGRSISYISQAVSTNNRSALLNIYDFVSVIPFLDHGVDEFNGTSLTNMSCIEREKLELQEVINAIHEKDTRYNKHKLSVLLFGNKNKIHNALYSTTNTNNIKKIRLLLTTHLEEMKDYSGISSFELSEKISNMLINIGYTKVDMSRVMGKGHSYITNACNRYIRISLLEIFEFMNTLCKSDTLKGVHRTAKPEDTHNTSRLENLSNTTYMKEDVEIMNQGQFSGDRKVQKEINTSTFTNDTNKLVAKIGNSYLFKIDASGGEKLSFQVSPDLFDALPITDSFLDIYKDKLESELGFNFVKVRKVVTYIEEQY